MVDFDNDQVDADPDAPIGFIPAEPASLASLDRLRTYIGNKFSEYEERISDLERIVAQPTESVRFADIWSSTDSEAPEHPLNDAINRRG